MAPQAKAEASIIAALPRAVLVERGIEAATIGAGAAGAAAAADHFER
jgi:hypothetical protein